MRSRYLVSTQRQTGAVLVVSLIMLAVMTLFVISMLKTSVLELKIGGSSQVAAINQSNAESAIDNFLAVNNGRFAPLFLTAVGAAGPVAGSLAYAGYAGTVALQAAQLACAGVPPGVFGALQYNTPGLQAVQFDIAATARTSGFGASGDRVVVHQGVLSVVVGC